MSTAVDWTPLTRHDLDVPPDSLERSPQVSLLELAILWDEGHDIFDQIMRRHLVSRSGRPFSTHFSADYIGSLMADDWSGATISCLTGKVVEPTTGYAVSIGQTVESRGEAVTFTTLAPYVGVFHDPGKGTVDVDPVAIVATRREADALGVYCGATGGAYSFADGLGYWPPVLKCSCAHNTDGSVTTMLCPSHADTDPCLTMARVTGRRRTGTIRRGVCTACGHRS